MQSGGLQDKWKMAGQKYKKGIAYKTTRKINGVRRKVKIVVAGSGKKYKQRIQVLSPKTISTGVKMGNVVFFSFSEFDRHVVAKIKGRAVNSRYSNLNFRVQDLLKRWSTEDPAVIRQAITKSIKGTSRTIVFVGNDTYKSYWVAEEVKMTLEVGKPVYAIRLKDTNGHTPDVLTDNRIFLDEWSEEKLKELATR